MKHNLLLTCALIVLIMLASSCTYSSGSALMRISTMTENGYEMSVEKLNGTEAVNLRSVTKGEAYTANVAVEVKSGSLIVEFRDNGGNAVYTSEKLTQSGTVTAQLDKDAYRMVLIAEDFGGTVEAEVIN